LVPGTPLATFYGPGGHVVIFMGYDPNGKSIDVIDQYNKGTGFKAKPTDSEHEMYYSGSTPLESANNYNVVTWANDAAPKVLTYGHPN